MRIEFIDGLRGLFSLSVILHHYDLIFFQVSPQDTYNFFIGVCGFFIINGFILSYRFCQSKNSEYLTSVALRRYFRLTITPLASILMVYFLLKCNFFFLHDMEKIIVNLPEWVRIFYNFEPSLKDALYEGLWKMYFGYSQIDSYNPVLWTMQFSLKGSFFVLAFLALFGRLENRTPIYLVFAVLTILLDIAYFPFLFGMWLSDKLFTENTEPQRGILKNFIFAMLFVMGAVIAFYFSSTEITLYEKLNLPLLEKLKIHTVIFYHMLGTALMVFTVSKSDMLRKFFSMKFFTKFGSYSFSMYVLHIPILFTVGGFIFLKAINGGLTFAASVICSCVIAFSATVLAVILLHNFVDVPAGKLTKRIEKIFH